MLKLTIFAPLGAVALAACGNPQPATDNLDTANLAVNVIVANEVAVANDVVDQPDTRPDAPVAPAPAPKAAKPAAKPPAPKPAPAPPAPDPDPECAPEHRAAGHC
jgi:hypothetical protein